MANASVINGLSPVKHINGSPFNAQGNIYCIAADDTNGFAVGDPVKLTNTSDANGVPIVTAFAAKSPIVGVILGLGTSEGGIFNPANLNSTTRPAAAQSGNWYAIVADDLAGTIFEISEMGTGTALDDTAIGTRKNLNIATNNGFNSGVSISNAAPVTGDVPPVMLLGLARRSDNAFGNYARWLVLITDYAYAPNATAI